MLRNITKNDCSDFQDYCTRYGQSLFPEHSFKDLEKAFKLLLKYKNCIIDKENGKIRGILIIKKIDSEYHIKTVYKNPKILDRLLMFLMWNNDKDLILQLNDYKTVSVIKKHFFRFKGKTGNDYIYFRKYFKRVKKNV